MLQEQVCVRCVMDTSDPNIRFDESGVCNHCHTFETRSRRVLRTGEAGRIALAALADETKAKMRGRDYDCVLGLSGGVDSSYLAYFLTRELGLRVLAIHVDAGWNSELAVKNIENIVRTLGIDLDTHVVDWQEMRDLQVAFLRAGVPNLDIPQDHAFFSALYGAAIRHRIRFVMSGGNFATEAILPQAWGYNWSDRRHLLAIHRQFGSRKLHSYPTMSLYRYYLYYPYVRQLRVFRPLNFMSYDRDAAISTLEREVGYRYYDTKHGESRFTRFFQNYYLPIRFGYDKRRAHLSSLILSSQIDRASALKELDRPPFSPDEFTEEVRFVAKKLEISTAELEDLLSMPRRQHDEYPSNRWLFDLKDRAKASFSHIGVRFRGH